jgi:hypothetical protein
MKKDDAHRASHIRQGCFLIVPQETTCDYHDSAC